MEGVPQSINLRKLNMEKHKHLWRLDKVTADVFVLLNFLF